MRNDLTPYEYQQRVHLARRTEWDIDTARRAGDQRGYEQAKEDRELLLNTAKSTSMRQLYEEGLCAAARDHHYRSSLHLAEWNTDACDIVYAVAYRGGYARYLLEDQRFGAERVLSLYEDEENRKPHALDQ